MFETDVETRILNLEKKVKELELDKEALDREVEGLLAELQTTSDKLNTFIENPAHFTEKNWSELSAMKQDLDAKLEQQLANITNLKRLKERQASRRIEHHWLYVR